MPAAMLVAGCSTSRPAPVTERTLPPKGLASAPVAPAQPSPAAKSAPATLDTKRELYTVKPGDTLYSIALEHGLDYRDLALWNGIDNPAALKVGQQLRVTPVPGTASSGVVAAPLKTPGGTVQATPLGTAPTPPSTVAAPAPVPSVPPAGALVTEPKGVRLPYSDAAFAQLAAAESTQAQPQPQAQAKPEPRPEVKPSPRPEPSTDTARSPDSSEWLWPARGKLVATFNGSTNKGIDIAGKRGQAVLATAAGRVIFSGTGVRGMGKFIVIKHSEELISVYGHNDEVLVKYGQSVAKGQKIAEMGSSDADQVKLHFEIRRNGTPIDPLTLLPSPA